MTTASSSLDFSSILNPGDPFWNGIMSSLPAVFTMVAAGPDRTADNLSAMRPFYANMAAQAQQQQAMGLQAIQRAQAGADQMQTPGDAAGKAGTDFEIQQNNRKAEMERTLQANGVRPDSGAYTGALAGLNGAGASAGKVDAMNRASTGAATAKQGALAAIPGMYSHIPGSTEMMSAVGGMGQIAGLENAAFGNKVKNIASAFRPGTDPWKVDMPKSNVVYNYYNRPNGGNNDAPMTNAMGMPLGGGEGE